MSISLTFAVPPFGLSPAPVFTLTPVDGAEGLFTLVGGSSRLFVLDAAVHLPSYSPELTDEQAAGLELTDPADAMLLVVANPGASGTTVNLLAPIVVNARTAVGAQLILEDQDLPLRAELARA
ncbi:MULTISPECIES: flagellar assembly protein FliW [unclassified Curtobacterium]|jgi:flagellar assembly factor FliW|uniref:flagellar assembly protein FliW n=1 Tax=Bacteria TaxID=2 RepID=UPI000DAA86FC|nr:MULTISPECIES: flagellar assembly protein FliW [unclassified Curtobacterium]MBF4587311.1 flagellar assembly protein FliW [Curtobacterium sp. VKM Ac-2887]ROQ06115.1 flagellar assembly factor FliW [Curtobacterium sp. PhB171]ROQ22738.1 flagellar assembly factor FliW [Curtobacterium sp. PhB170]ROS34310.1 flagellar assembly factor FliW [Curtobacterium sp. PhB131]ROS67405.1 flagellar assembly factor FliW [Curtobacterium sp. PhB172]